jgi:hypothetical protein
MPRDDVNLNRLNRIFEEAVVLHGGDVKKVVSYVKAQISTSSREDRADIDRIFERLLAFRAPESRSQAPN